MYVAVLDGVELARSDRTVEVEGNQYFPPDDVNQEYFEKSDHHTKCPWKGKASYYHINAGGKRIDNGAWYYPAPLSGASHIEKYVAFYSPVEVRKE